MSTTRKQHTSPCAACPFSRNVKPYADDKQALGQTSPFTYVGQANGPFVLPCHATHDYSELAERLKAAQPGSGCECAGAAIFRANIGLAYPDPLLHLPHDREKVFGTFVEFVAHHYKISLDAAQLIVQDMPPDFLTRLEMMKAQARASRGEAYIRPLKRGG